MLFFNFFPVKNREGKVRDMLNQVHRLQETYRCFDDSIDDKILDKKTKEEQQQQRSTMISNMPQSLTKFDQKCVISSEGSKLVSNVSILICIVLIAIFMIVWF